MLKIFVTGAAGFIGSNVVDRLLKLGHSVVGFDNLSTGQIKMLDQATKCPNFQFIHGDLLDQVKLAESMNGCDFVFHFAANADVRYGLDKPQKDLYQNTMATSNVLEAMRVNKIRRIVFSSTGSVYGEAKIIPTPETENFPVQTSLYGASKVACEGLITSYCVGYNFEAYIFRFVSILGERYSHGHIFDFYKQLTEHPDQLIVLGDGTQKKSYLYIQDCIDAILHCIDNSIPNKYNIHIYNLGPDEYVQVKESVNVICEKLQLSPQINFTGGHQGWIGDNPFIFLDTNKIQRLGWKPKLSIKNGIEKTLDWLIDNKWIYEARK